MMEQYEVGTRIGDWEIESIIPSDRSLVILRCTRCGARKTMQKQHLPMLGVCTCAESRPKCRDTKKLKSDVYTYIISNPGCTFKQLFEYVYCRPSELRSVMKKMSADRIIVGYKIEKKTPTGWYPAGFKVSRSMER